MSRIKYISKKFKPPTLETIERANEIIDEYALQGYDLTLRQLYYQFVARDLILNNQAEYNKLGSVINNARLAGLIDWNSIVDRTRALKELTTWEGPEEVLDYYSKHIYIDYWEEQPYHVEVWIEKDALKGVISGACNLYRVPYFACRGYVSQSAMWRAAKRVQEALLYDRNTIILHLGDHDPSGIDMTRDIINRFEIFGVEGVVDVRRLALNMDQVEKYNPPPNPTKLTDSRSKDYVNKFGDNSWELDALEPSVITKLIKDAIKNILNKNAWNKCIKLEKKYRHLLKKVSDDWDTLTEGLYD